MFVDTSAIIAILTSEVEAADLTEQIDAAELRITSPLVLLEATMVLSTRRAIEPRDAEAHIRQFADRIGLAVIQIDDETATLAIDAFARFGKGRGNAAKLNMSDCLSYACARRHRVPLLYVGKDFVETDLA